MVDWPFVRSPFAVQIEALRQAEGRAAFLFLLEQGLGKTAIILAEYIKLRAQGVVDCLILVTPNSLKGNWKDEAEILKANVDFAIWPFKVGRLDAIPEAIVVNYEALSIGRQPGRGGDLIIKLMQQRRVYLALDEVHRIRNHASNVGRFVLSHLIKDATIRRGATGTPYGSSVFDLYPQLRLAGALNGMNPFVFRSRYAVMGGFQGRQVVGIRPERREELEKLISDHGFRATKDEWAKDIPPRLYRTTRVELPTVVAKAYQEMQRDFLVMLDDEAVTATMAITQCIKLQQISSGFLRDEEGKDHDLVLHKDLPKFKALLDVIEANGGSKTIVFAHFRHTVANLAGALLVETGEAPEQIVGGMTTEELRTARDRFNDDDGPGVVLIQIQAGKEGITLLGGATRRCYTNVFYESNFNSIDRSQCEARAHRFGQVNNLLIVDFVSSPIEATIIAALQTKKDVATTLLDARRLGTLA